MIGECNLNCVFQVSPNSIEDNSGIINILCGDFSNNIYNEDIDEGGKTNQGKGTEGHNSDQAIEGVAESKEEINRML